MKIKLYLNKQVEVDLNLIEFLKGCFNQRDCNYDDVHFSPLHNCTRHSYYIVDVVMRPNFGNSSIMRDIINFIRI